MADYDVASQTPASDAADGTLVPSRLRAMKGVDRVLKAAAEP
jgi:hypothetical protein